MKIVTYLTTGWLSPLRLVLSLFFMLGATHNSQAQTVATAEINDTPLGGGVYDYSIILTDTGSTPIETFWFSWIPGADFLLTKPTNIVSPTDWTANITGSDNASDGNAIQWVTPASSTTAPLDPGDSLTFSFDSTDTPAAIAGDSVYGANPPVGTSFVYSGAPFSGTSDEFIVQSVPEPSSLDLLVVGMLGVCCLGWRRFYSRFHS
jgi:hypothetical protein